MFRRYEISSICFPRCPDQRNLAIMWIVFINVPPIGHHHWLVCISSVDTEPPRYDMYLPIGHRVSIIVVMTEVTHWIMSLLKSSPIYIAAMVDPPSGNVEAYHDRLKVIVIHIGKAKGPECQKPEEDMASITLKISPAEATSKMKFGLGKPSRTCGWVNKAIGLAATCVPGPSKEVGRLRPNSRVIWTLYGNPATSNTRLMTPATQVGLATLGG